jgi:hypothetical protein
MRWAESPTIGSDADVMDLIGNGDCSPSNWFVVVRRPGD